MTARRRGAVPPIVTVIIVVAAVVAAALAAYFIYATTARGARQVMLTVVGQPTLYATSNGVELRVTFKNDGTAPVNLTDSVVVIQDKYKNAVEFTLSRVAVTSSGQPPSSQPSSGQNTPPKIILDPGTSVSLVYTATGKSLDDFPDGALATLQTAGGYQISFAVAKP